MKMNPYSIPKIMLVGYPGSGKSSIIPTLPWYGNDEEEAEMEGLSDDAFDEKTGRYICSFLLDPQGIQAYSHGIQRMKVIKVTSGDTIRIPQIFKKPGHGDKPIKMSLGFDQYQRFASKLTVMIQTREIYDFKWVVFDSLSFLTDSMLYEIVEKEQRLGFKYTIEDYGRVATLVKVLISSVLSCGIPLVVTAHCRDFIRRVDEHSNPVEIVRQLATYGMLRDHFPAMFDNIFQMGIEYFGNSQTRTIQLAADGGDNYSRTTLMGIEDKTYDVTLDYGRNTRQQGLYDVFKKFRPMLIDNYDIEEI